MRVVPLVLCALALSACSASAAPDRSTRRADLPWTAPDFADFDVRSIAFLPVAMYESNIENRGMVERAVGQALKGTGYRFASTMIARQWLVQAGGDSLLKAVNDAILHEARPDSLQAPLLARVTRSRALLGVRVDRMERMQLEPDQSGKPTTTVELHVALVDSTGRLLWSAHGAETMDGQYQDAANGSLGVKASGLSNQLVTDRLGAPTFPEVLTRLLARWTPSFPSRPAAPAAN